MSFEQKPMMRKRVNVAQTAKGLHQVECTIEVIDVLKSDPQDVAKFVAFDVSTEVLNTIKGVEEALKKDGRKLVTSEP